jgi:hypothetical protein
LVVGREEQKEELREEQFTTEDTEFTEKRVRKGSKTRGVGR